MPVPATSAYQHATPSQSAAAAAVSYTAAPVLNQAGYQQGQQSVPAAAAAAAGAASTAALAVALPEGWTAAIDSVYNTIYYFNVSTGGT